MGVMLQHSVNSRLFWEYNSLVTRLPSLGYLRQITTDITEDLSQQYAPLTFGDTITEPGIVINHFCVVGNSL